MQIRSTLLALLIITISIAIYLLACDSGDDDDASLDDDSDDTDDDSADDDDIGDDDDDDDGDDPEDPQSYSGAWEGEIEVRYYDGSPTENDTLRHVIVVEAGGALVGSLSYGEGIAGGDAPFKELTEGELRTSDDIVAWSMDWKSSSTGRTYRYNFSGVIQNIDFLAGSFDSIEPNLEQSYSHGDWTLARIEE